MGKPKERAPADPWGEFKGRITVIPIVGGGWLVVEGLGSDSWPVVAAGLLLAAAAVYVLAHWGGRWSRGAGTYHYERYLAKRAKKQSKRESKRP